jgi:hypothetical protein
MTVGVPCVSVRVPGAQRVASTGWCAWFANATNTASPAELTKQTLDLKELFDVGRVPHPHLPDNHPENRTIEGVNRWPPGQVV